ncbi:MAG: LacI family DNA-binding transcriptional regulator [Lachnospiraceae bacterium]|nr:LacI family DNA-binding transcriptional regulator [Lachnospiraceae bacterium]
MSVKNVTMKDIAKRLNVSIVTVSKALAGKDGVGSELREKIIATADEIGYVPKNNGANSEGKNQIVAIIMSERYLNNDNSFYFQIYQKMIKSLSLRGHIGILEIVRKEDEEASNLPKIFRMESISQIVIIGEMKNHFLESVVSTGIKVIFFDFENEEYDVDCIAGDSINGGYTLTRHLVKNGYRKIGFIGNYKATRSILDRFTGYMKYLIARDLRMEEKWIISDRDKDGRFIPLVFPEEMPEAFVCNCDEAAYKLIAQLNQAGYRVPEDIAVVGYDDYADNVLPGVSLTTYHVNTEEMINQCIRVIENKDNEPEGRKGIMIIPGRLVVRETVLKRNVT